MKARPYRDRIALKMLPIKTLKSDIIVNKESLLNNLRKAYKSIDQEGQKSALSKFQDWPFMGKVVGVGYAVEEIKEGDVVYIRPGAGITAMLSGIVVTLITPGDIIGVVTKDK